MKARAALASAAAILAACGATPAAEPTAIEAPSEERPPQETDDHDRPAMPPPPPTTTTSAVAPDGLRWALVATPTRMTMAERAGFRLSRQVTNEGSAPADPMHAGVAFTVNGESSFALGMAFGNGIRGPEWQSLPPGATASDERDMGDALFGAPGDYDIAMAAGGATVHAFVHVDP